MLSTLMGSSHKEIHSQMGFELHLKTSFVVQLNRQGSRAYCPKSRRLELSVLIGRLNDCFSKGFGPGVKC